MQFLSPFGHNNVNGNNTSSYVLMAKLVSFSTTPLSSVARPVLFLPNSGRYTPLLKHATRALLTTARRRLLPKGQLDPGVGLALVTHLSCALLNHLKDTTSSLPRHNDRSPSPPLCYWSYP